MRQYIEEEEEEDGVEEEIAVRGSWEGYVFCPLMVREEDLIGLGGRWAMY